MLNKNKSSRYLPGVVFLYLQVLALTYSFGQATGDTDNNNSEKVVYHSLSKALRNADKVYKLNLSNKDLKEFPEDILKLKELRYLILDSNQITTIPPEINKLENLKCLSLSHNLIQELPTSTGDLSNLKYLYFDNNKISVLPSSFFKLAQLEDLFISYNNLTFLPPEIRVLKELKSLQASNNQFGEIPDEIGYLYNLEFLSMTNNHIKNLPEHFYELTNLKALFLSENELIEIDPKIIKFDKLETLAIDKNKLTSLPSSIGDLSELRNLYFEHNKIDSLPKEIGNLFNLKELFFGDNPIKEIPVSYNRLTNLQFLNIKNLSFQPFPQALYDIQNNGTKIVGLTTNELYQAKLLLSQARNRKLTENYDEAITKYETLIKLDTNNVAAMSELAGIYLLKGEYDKAANICQRGLSKNASQKTLDEIRSTYSNSLNRTNKYDLIINSYTAKIKADSNNANSYFELGKFYYDQKKYEEAKTTFMQALKVDPSHANSHFYFAVVCLDQDQEKLFILSSLQLFMLEPDSRKTATTFPFLLTRMKMRSGVESKKGTTSYFDSYIIRNESNEIVYKSESPQADILSAMLSDIMKSDKFSNDTSQTDEGLKKIVQAALYTNKNNVEIFQLELERICKNDTATIKEENRKFYDYYLPYYADLITSGNLETFSYLINSYRSNDSYITKWLKNNSEKVEKFKLWNKNYKWIKH